MEKMHTRRLISAFALLATFATRARAQDATQPGPAVGTRVRLVVHDSARRITGTVVARRSDTLAVQASAARTATLVPIATIDQYAVSRGHDRARGARRGALVGGAVGVGLLVAVAIGDASTKKDVLVPGTVLVLPLALGVTVLGAGVGALVAPERWETQPARSARRAAGVRLGLAFAF